MHAPHLLTNLTAGMLAAFVGGLAARRARLPTIVGYLLGGMAIGPFTPGFVGDSTDLSALAELGVLFLMFGVGLHFSLRDLWDVRRIALPGAVVQMLLSTLTGFALGRAWGLETQGATVLGVSISIASTVVLLKGLEDRGLLNSSHGRVAMGWLVLEDLATIVVLVLLPALTSRGSESLLLSVSLSLAKAAAFVAVMLVVGARAMPWLLARIATLRSHELFNVAVVSLAVGTAFLAAELFGVSLALGAFLAGAVIGESSLKHEVEREIQPFRETFSVLFFVSIGMLVDPVLLAADLGPVLALTALIVIGKATITVGLALGLRASLRTALVVAAGLGQIGEFSFVVGRSAVSLGILEEATYARLLAAALLSITVNPLLFALAPRLERLFARRIAEAPIAEPPALPIRDHVIVVGYGRIGRHVVSILATLEFPFLVVERDEDRADALEAAGVRTLVGDAANSDVLTHAELGRARAIVSTISDGPSNELVVASCHAAAPDVPIVARASSLGMAVRLYDAGARHVVEPELEGGLEVVRRTLLTLGYPATQVHRYTEEARRAHRQGLEPDDVEHELLARMLEAVQVDVAWRAVREGGPLSGRSLDELALRPSFGVSVVALVRGADVQVAPTATTRLEVGDHLGFIGRAEDVGRLDAWLGADVR